MDRQDNEFEVAQWLDTMTTALHEPRPEAQARVWQVVQSRIAPQSQRRKGFMPQVQIRTGRVVSIGSALAVALVLVLIAISPAGRSALAASRTVLEAVLGPVLRAGPDGKVIPVPVMTPGSSIIDVEGLVSLPEAEEQVGFKAHMPTALPTGTQLLGARTSLASQHRSETPRIEVVFLVGDKPLTLIESEGVPVDANLRDAQRIRVGSTEGWLQSIGTDDLPHYALTWDVQGRSYWLAGPLPRNQLLQIAESIPTTTK
jgi:hypothetical protein